MTFTVNDRFKMFTLSSNEPLTRDIVEHLGSELGGSNVQRFSDGEVKVNVEESVRGGEIYVVQSIAHPSSDHLMELLIMIDALKRASAKRINLVIPYFGYSRQDRKARSREPITAKLIANLLQAAGATRVITMDLHAPQIQGFFDIAVDHLLGMPILSKYFAEKQIENGVIVAPNNGGVKAAREMADILGMPIAFIDKRQTGARQSEIVKIIGETAGKNAIIIDDLMDTGKTMASAAHALKESGTELIYACCTHAVLSGNAVELIEQAPIEEMVVTDTIDIPEAKQGRNMKVLSAAPLFAEAISRVHNRQSVDKLFKR